MLYTCPNLCIRVLICIYVSLSVYLTLCLYMSVCSPPSLQGDGGLPPAPLGRPRPALAAPLPGGLREAAEPLDSGEFLLRYAQHPSSSERTEIQRQKNYYYIW